MMNLENVNLTISLFGTVIGLLITILTFLIKFCNNAKARKKAMALNKVLAQIIPLMEVAEKFTSYSGEEKKEFVLTRVNQYAIDNHITFHSDEISKKIEELVDLSKKVNSKNQNKSKNWL